MRIKPASFYSHNKERSSISKVAYSSIANGPNVRDLFTHKNTVSIAARNRNLYLSTIEIYPFSDFSQEQLDTQNQYILTSVHIGPL